MLKKSSKSSKSSKIFFCACCDYKTSRKGNYEKHLSTQKHKNKMLKNVENPLKIVEKVAKNSITLGKTNNHVCCNCGKSYKDRSNFFPYFLNKAEAPPLVESFKKLDYEFIFYGNSWSNCNPKHFICGSVAKNLSIVELFLDIDKVS